MMSLVATAALLNPEANFALQPHTRLIDGVMKSVTLCNAFASVFCAARGVLLPPKLANEQARYLAGHPLEWERVSKDEAHALANGGNLVLAVAEALPHGHIAPLVESPPEDKTHVYVAAAGARNFNCARLESSFGFLSPVFYGHRRQ